MKKNSLLLVLIVFIYFSFMSVVNSAMPSFSACTTSGNATVLESEGTSSSAMCSAQPDTYKLTIYEMKLCTAAITAPTTSSAAVTTNCQAVLTNTNPTAMTITKGGSSDVTGTITRPPNGTYTHGYMLLSNVLSIADSRIFSTSLDDADDDTPPTADGVWCATTATAGEADCNTSEVTAADPVDMKLGQTHFGTNYTAGEQAVSGYGTMNAWLVESDKALGGGTGVKATDDAAISYLVGQMQFTTPVIVSDDTTTFNMSVDVSNGILFLHQSQSGWAPQLVPYAGPFMMRITVE